MSAVHVSSQRSANRRQVTVAMNLISGFDSGRVTKSLYPLICPTNPPIKVLT